MKKLFTKKAIALFIAFSSCVLFYNAANAQMSGTYTVCASGCDYSSINGAVSALQTSGINGPTTISIKTGSYNESITINGISGASATNTITFAGTGSSPSDVYIYNYYRVLYLSNSSYISFENVAMEVTSNYYYYNTIEMYNSKNCTFKNNTLKNTSTSNYGNSVVRMYGCANILIDENEITGGYYAILDDYNYSYTNSNNTISNNKISNFYWTGLYTYQSKGTKISGNTFSNSVNTYANAIYSYYAKDMTVYGNTVSGMYYGLGFFYYSEGDVNIVNNMISLGSNDYFGVYFYGNNTTSNIKFQHNTINSTGNSGYLVYMYGNSGQIDFQNNNLTRSSGYGYMLYYYNNYNTNDKFEGNNFYAASSFQMIWRGGYYSSLSSYRSAAAYYNTGSTDQSVAVTYVGTNDLHLASGSNVPTGTNVGVNYDIDGDARGATTVASGADEAASDQPPVAVAKNITIYLDANGEATISAADIDNGSSDDNAITSSSVSQSAFDCSNLGDNNVVLTVTDASSQSDDATAIVTVVDNTAPEVSVQDVTVTLNSNGTATVSSTDVNDNSTDNCSIASYSLSQTSFDCSDLGENTVTLTVTDGSGNSATKDATVTVLTTLTANAGSDVTVYYGYTPMASATLSGSATNGGSSYSYKWSTGATTKNITVSPTTTTTYTLTVTDNNGCTATDKVTVTVVDVRCGSKSDKVLVCHKGEEICIAASAVSAHLDHGCKLGSCSSSHKNGSEGFGNEEIEGGHSDAHATILNAYPNPFASSATIEFTVAKNQQISLAVYDVQGRKVQDVYTGNAQENTLYRYKIDGTQLPADVYFVRLIADDKVQNLRIVLTK